jgi:hypothetical protein
MHWGFRAALLLKGSSNAALAVVMLCSKAIVMLNCYRAALLLNTVIQADGQNVLAQYTLCVNVWVHACVNDRQSSNVVSGSRRWYWGGTMHGAGSTYVSIRQHTSAYVSIRQHAPSRQLRVQLQPILWWQTVLLLIQVVTRKWEPSTWTQSKTIDEPLCLK